LKQYILVCEALESQGFKQYEISNFAKPGKISGHNLNYWQGGHYVGLGIGAHSYMGTTRSWNISSLTQYISRLQNGLSVEEGSEELSIRTRMQEVFLFGLRMNLGIDIEDIQKRFDCFLSSDQNNKIKHFVESGFLIQEGHCLRTSLKGRLVLDELCVQLMQ